MTARNGSRQEAEEKIDTSDVELRKVDDHNYACAVDVVACGSTGASRE